MYRRWIWPLVAASLGTCLLATSVVGEPESASLPPLTLKNYKEVAEEVDALVTQIERQEARLLEALESPKTRSAVKILAVSHLLTLHRREIVRRAVRKLTLKGDPERASGRSLGPASRAMPFPYQDLLTNRGYNASRELLDVVGPNQDEDVLRGVVRVYRDVWGTETAKAIFKAVRSTVEVQFRPSFDRVLGLFESMPDLDVSGFPKKEQK